MTRLNTAMTSMSQPKVRSFRGPFSPMMGKELSLWKSNELRYEITATPIRYGHSQTALFQSNDGRRSGALVAYEMASRMNPMTMATINFHTTTQPENRMISLATMNPAGARIGPPGSRNGR